jgi:hypothetical protein
MSKPLPRVFFLTNNPRYYIRPARRFGRSVFLFTEDPSPFMVSRTLDNMKRALKREEFTPGRDVLALTGSSTLLSLLCVVAASNYERFDVLVYNPREKQYHQHPIEAAYDYRETDQTSSRYVSATADEESADEG